MVYNSLKIKTGNDMLNNRMMFLVSAESCDSLTVGRWLTTRCTEANKSHFATSTQVVAAEAGNNSSAGKT